jgi:hypothetical protein
LPFDLDEMVDLSRAREIALAGMTLKVAPLQLRQIIATSRLLPQLLAAENPEDRLNTSVDFVLIGLNRAYPNLTRDELLDSEISTVELRDAVDAVILQSGGRKADPAGEVEAASTTARPIGTSSSPNSAST